MVFAFRQTYIRLCSIYKLKLCNLFMKLVKVSDRDPHQVACDIWNPHFAVKSSFLVGPKIFKACQMRGPN